MKYNSYPRALLSHHCALTMQYCLSVQCAMLLILHLVKRTPYTVSNIRALCLLIICLYSNESLVY